MIRHFHHNYTACIRMTIMLWFSVFISIGLGTHSVNAGDSQLVADLSENSISIESDFDGTELLLFGAISRVRGLASRQSTTKSCAISAIRPLIYSP